MGTPIILLLIFFVTLGVVLSGVGFVIWRHYLRRAKGIERGLKMVPVIIHLPPPDESTIEQNHNEREAIKEKIAQAEVLYNLIAGTALKSLKSNFFGQRHIAFEIVAHEGLIYFYAAIPVILLSLVKEAIQSAYPGARIEEAEDHNIFSWEGKLPGTVGGEINLKNIASYPIATYKVLERDPMETIIDILHNLKNNEGAGIQFLIRPANSKWINYSKNIVSKKQNKIENYTVSNILQAPFKVPGQNQDEEIKKVPSQLSNLEQEVLKEVEDKTKYPAFEILIRLIVSTLNFSRSEAILQDLATSFALFERPGLNGFKFISTDNVPEFVTDFIF